MLPAERSWRKSSGTAAKRAIKENTMAIDDLNVSPEAIANSEVRRPSPELWIAILCRDVEDQRQLAAALRRRGLHVELTATPKT
jgi:ATP-dependent exoDNAse (exonuclease V) beta subunit